VTSRREFLRGAVAAVAISALPASRRADTFDATNGDRGDVFVDGRSITYAVRGCVSEGWVDRIVVDSNGMPVVSYGKCEAFLRHERVTGKVTWVPKANA
jgi:hypothetical protein